MSTLTGQQINNTYDGLLKLSDSTTGITSTLQAVEDGLGNNTGSRISTNQFFNPTIAGVYNSNYSSYGKPDFMGMGFVSTTTAPVANSNNRLIYTIFYDPGVLDYSAITYNLQTLTSTSDVVNCSFYTTQLVSGRGVAPKDLIMSGISFTSTGSTGVKTTVLPSTLSFSGTGGGWYIFAAFITNAGVTQTVRYGNTPLAASNQSLTLSQGFYYNAAQTGINLATIVSTGIVPSNYLIINSLAQQASYSASDIITNLNTTTLAAFGGFGLNVIK